MTSSVAGFSTVSTEAPSLSVQEPSMYSRYDTMSGLPSSSG